MTTSMISDNNLTNKTFIGMIWILLGKTGNFILQTIVTIILARLLSPQEYGTVTTALVVINFCDVFLIHTITPIIIQKNNLKNEYIGTVRTFSLIIGLILFIICNLISNQIAIFFGVSKLSIIIKSMSITFIINSLSVVDSAYYQKNMLFKFISLRQLISYFIGYGIVGMVMAISGFGVWSLIIAYITQSIVNFIVMKVNRKIPSKFLFHKEFILELVKKSFGYAMGRMGTFFALQGDNFVIGKFLGADVLGIYGKAYQFFSMPVSYIGEMFEKGLFSALSNCKNDNERFKQYFNNIFTLNILTVLPFSIYIYVFSQELIIFILGEQWIESSIPFKILSIGISFRIMYKLCESILTSLGFIYKKAIIEIFYAVSIILGALMGVHYGLKEVCWFVLLAVITNFIIVFTVCIRELELRPKYIIKNNIIPILSSVIIFVLLKLVRKYINIKIKSIFLKLSVSFIYFGGCYLIIYIAMFKFKELEKLKNVILRVIKEKKDEKR